MAQTAASDAGGGGRGWIDDLKDFAGLAIDYTRAKNIDVETQNSGGYVPDRQDYEYGTGNNAGSSTGKQLTRTYGGLTPGQLGLLGAGVVGGVVLLKAVGVIK